MSDLQIGMIGVNATRGWAREAHVPAVDHLPGMHLAAVATRRIESAEAAAVAYGADRAYGDPAELVVDPGIDVVAVVSSVPSHRDLIESAVRAGKDVVTEWPVGTSWAQTEEIADLVRRGGRRMAVGLQARTDPAVRAAQDAVADGRVGRVLTVSAYSTTAGFGAAVPEGELYLEDPATGMNLPTIQAAHTLDLVQQVGGPLVTTDSLTTVQFPELQVGEGRTARRTVGDHVLVHGRLAGGAVAAVQVAGGRPADRTPFWLEVVGEEGRLLLSGGAPRGFQAGRLTLTLDGTAVEVDPGERAGLPPSAFNVAGTYAALRDDIAGGTSLAAGPDDATALARLVHGLVTT